MNIFTEWIAQACITSMHHVIMTIAHHVNMLHGVMKLLFVLSLEDQTIESLRLVWSFYWVGPVVPILLLFFGRGVFPVWWGFDTVFPLSLADAVTWT